MEDRGELHQLAIAELQQLQRQHRSLILELRRLLDDKLKRLKKQNHMINVLQKEHEILKEEVQILESGTHTRRNINTEERLGYLQKKNKDIQRIYQNERTNLWELEGHIKKMDKEVDVLRKNEVPDCCYRDTIFKVQKSVVKLENRLDVANKKSSNILADNCKLRYSINHMLQDRANFNEMWQSMVTQFNEGKKYIIDLIDQSSLAFDQRAELCNKLQALKDRNENDKIMHIQEMRELQRRLEHDVKLQKFFDIKGQKRLNPELEQREMDQKSAKKEHYEKQLYRYREVIEIIKQSCCENNSGGLVAQFKRQEDENFALFNYVNELSHEVEALSDTTQELTEEIERQKSDQDEKELKQKTEALDFLGAKQKRIYNLAKEAREIKVSLNDRLHEILIGIGQIFKQLSCNDTPVLNVLSAKTILTVYNAKLFIGIIERHINFIIYAINIEDKSVQIRARKDRVPKFNVKETAKAKSYKNV